MTSNDGFTKLFSSIISSSIWSEDDKTRLMWITMLAASDSQGYVTGSIPGMAALARMDLKDAEKSINALTRPDPYSRTKEYEGRRLLECDGGWLIANYAKYRQKRDPEKRREQNRKAQAKYRETHKENGESKPKVSRGKPESAHAEAEAEAEADNKKNYCAIDIEISQLLYKLIQKNKPDYPEPNIENWAVDVRRLREIEKKTPEQIKAVMEWAQADDFWWKNVMSPASLRKKSKTDGITRIDRIEMQMKRNTENAGNSGSSTTGNGPFIR